MRNMKNNDPSFPEFGMQETYNGNYRYMRPTEPATPFIRYPVAPAPEVGTQVKKLAPPPGAAILNSPEERTPMMLTSLPHSHYHLPVQQGQSTAPPSFGCLPADHREIPGSECLRVGSLPVSATASPNDVDAAEAPNASAVHLGTPFNRLKVDDALTYLDLVKDKFSNKPHLYSEFLDIMKDFKANKIDTYGVVASIKKLFTGYPDLIYSFNTFLPPAFYIQNDKLTENEFKLLATSVRVASNEQAQPNFLSDTDSKFSKSSKIDNNPQMNPQYTHMLHSTRPDQPISVHSQTKPPIPSAYETHSISQSTGALISPMAGRLPSQDSTPSQYALDYVAKIKNRFSKVPDIYQRFLDILSHCRNQQRLHHEGTIESKRLHDEVYRKVAALFKNDGDLLEEFVHFLPDYVPPHNVLQPETESINNKMKRKAPTEDSVGKVPPRVEHSVIAEKSAPVKLVMSKSVRREAGQSHMVTPPPPPPPPPPRPHSPIDDLPQCYPSWFKSRDINTPIYDENLFKVVFSTVSTSKKKHFLRLVSLFNLNYISQQEMTSLVSQIFKENAPLLDRVLKKICDRPDFFLDNRGSRPHNFVYDGSAIGQQHPLQVIDFNPHKRIGVSYWPYKLDFVQPRCSGVSDLGREVLNIDFVSQPILSEYTTFPGAKRTPSIEVLQRVEQERYDMDMIIHSNRQALAYLEEELRQVQQNRHYGVDLLAKSPAPFAVLNCYKCLQRIYGEGSPIIFEGLKSCCKEVLPVVLARLKMKENEWNLDQQKMNKVWFGDLKKHTLKALDFQGPSFKTMDIKNIRFKHFLREIDACESGNPLRLTFHYNYYDVCTNCLHFIHYSIKRLTSINKTEKLKIYAFLSSFHAWMFNVNFESLDVFDEKEALAEYLTEFSHSGNGSYLYITSHIYIYLRLYHLLCLRLSKVHVFVESSHDAFKFQNIAYYSDFNLGTKKNGNCRSPEIELEEQDQDNAKVDIYDRFQTMMYSLIDGTIDADYFEEGCRCMFGLDSYVLFTIDKIISGIVRQLCSIIGSTSNSHLGDLHVATIKYPINLETNIVVNPIDFVRHWRSCFDEDSCYLVCLERPPDGDTVLTFKIIDIGSRQDDSASEASVEDEWDEFLSHLSVSRPADMGEKGGDGTGTGTGTGTGSKLFLQRNLVRCQNYRKFQKLFLTEERASASPATKKSHNLRLNPTKAVINFKLEHEVVEGTGKLKFITGTSDISYIRGRLKVAMEFFLHHSNKVDKFRRWWNSKVGLHDVW